MQLLGEAEVVAERYVAPLGRRWKHVQAVAAEAKRLATALDAEDQQTLVAAAWLHDIGYSPDIAHVRFHPLDGARHLREHGWPETIVNLVAHHSAARYEAEERGLSDQLSEFPFELSPLQDALDMADLTTGPDGQHMTFDGRMDEILERYAPEDPVHLFWLRARPVEAEAVARTEARLATAQPR